VFRFTSILSRIMFLHVVAVLVTALCMPLALYWFLSSDVDSLQKRALHAQAMALARHLTPRAGGGWSLDLPAGIRDQYSDAYGRYSYAVLEPSGSLLFSSHKPGAPIFAIEGQAGDVAFHEARSGDRPIVGASLQVRIADRHLFIQVAEDLAHRDVLIDDIVANFFRNVAWVTVPIMLLLLTTDLVIFRRAVQPLLRASDRAAHISPTRIDVRLPPEDIPSEIRPLVIAVNQALDRLEQGFRRQREFAADAAHELRTPLTILRTRIDTLPDQQAAEALHRNVEGMTRVVNQLLDAAELETVTIGAHDRADLVHVCAELAEFIAPLALAEGKNIALTGADGPVWINGHSEMVRRAIRNLVENALKHSPKGSDVEIVVGKGGSVTVLDEGEGIPTESREHIFQRFWRRDRQDPDGAGLGLSIVKRIVDAHGATIAVDNRPTGGAKFTIHFVLAAAPAPASDAAELGSVDDRAH
jgi:signal transduction histidine kinase